MHESNKLYMLETGRKKNTRGVKYNKSNFMKFIGENFALSIKYGETTISFLKKFFSCILNTVFSYLYN